MVSAITQPVGEMDCVALRLIGVWAEAAQISNLGEVASHRFGGSEAWCKRKKKKKPGK